MIKLNAEEIKRAVECADEVQEAANGGGKLVDCTIEFDEFWLVWDEENRRWEVRVPESNADHVAKPVEKFHDDMNTDSVGDDGRCGQWSDTRTERCWFRPHQGTPHSWERQPEDMVE